MDTIFRWKCVYCVFICFLFLLNSLWNLIFYEHIWHLLTILFKIRNLLICCKTRKLVQFQNVLKVEFLTNLLINICCVLCKLKWICIAPKDKIDFILIVNDVFEEANQHFKWHEHYHRMRNGSAQFHSPKMMLNQLNSAQCQLFNKIRFGSMNLRIAIDSLYRCLAIEH